MTARPFRIATTFALALALLVATAPAHSADRGIPYRDAGYAHADEGSTQVPYVLAQAQGRDSLDLEQRDGGYTTEYIFGLTKGLIRSTLEPALKPAVMILTVPLDIALLPFAALGGFFR